MHTSNFALASFLLSFLEKYIRLNAQRKDPPVFIITIEFMFAGINMFWARLRLILSRAAITIIITLEGIEKIKTEKK